MKNGIVILLEDEKSIQESFKTLFDDLEVGLTLIVCSKPEEFEHTINKPEIKAELRALIMDLSNTHEEVISQHYKAAEYIKSEYENNRIPIFIHSGNLDHYHEFPDKGTVFKIEKNRDSAVTICNDIKKYKDSQFLDIFRNGGILEKLFMQELHSAFVDQFKNEEIKTIISSIYSSNLNNLEARTIEIFKRIAVRSLYTNLISAKKNNDSSIQEVKLNSIEHYFRRNSAFKFWTGDIFISNEDNDMYVIITPRCNLGHIKHDELTLCKVLPISETLRKAFLNTNSKKAAEELKIQITDNSKVGERYRFLPPSPQFNGGTVDFLLVKTLKTEELKSKYSYVISLSDELTNDVVRKYASFMLRGGISETDFNESLFFCKDGL